MKQTIYLCDVCNESGATPVRVRPLAIGIFDIDGIFQRFTSVATARFNEVSVELCENCANKTEHVPLVAYTRSNGTRTVMFNEEGAQPIDYPKLAEPNE